MLADNGHPIMMMDSDGNACEVNHTETAGLRRILENLTCDYETRDGAGGFTTIFQSKRGERVLFIEHLANGVTPVAGDNGSCDLLFTDIDVLRAIEVVCCE